jgi:hypothetical protein
MWRPLIVGRVPVVYSTVSSCMRFVDEARCKDAKALHRIIRFVFDHHLGSRSISCLPLCNMLFSCTSTALEVDFDVQLPSLTMLFNIHCALFKPLVLAFVIDHIHCYLSDVTIMINILGSASSSIRRPVLTRTLSVGCRCVCIPQN